MSAGARRGALPTVLRAMGLTGDELRAGHANALGGHQTATCPECKGTLRFFTGDYGQTIEQCDTRSCVNAMPHRPQADPDAGPPKGRGGTQGKRVKRAPKPETVGHNISSVVDL